MVFKPVAQFPQSSFFLSFFFSGNPRGCLSVSTFFIFFDKKGPPPPPAPQTKKINNHQKLSNWTLPLLLGEPWQYRFWGSTPFNKLPKWTKICSLTHDLLVPQVFFNFLFLWWSSLRSQIKTTSSQKAEEERLSEPSQDRFDFKFHLPQKAMNHKRN